MKQKISSIGVVLWHLVRQNSWVMWMTAWLPYQLNDWRFFAVLIPVAVLNAWSRESGNGRIIKLERVVKVNGDFWSTATSDSTRGMELIETMRELCDASLPNNPALPRG